MKVLMVCLGNICRSPLAQGILEKKKPDWTVDSAGTAAYHIGKKPDQRSITTAQKNGINIEQQAARQIKPDDLDEFDLILTMDAENYSNVIAMAENKEQRQKVHLILNFIEPGMNKVVPDPYYDNRFDEVYELLDKATDQIVRKYS